MDQDKIDEILHRHEDWLRLGAGCARAVLIDAVVLRLARLRGALIRPYVNAISNRHHQ
jgi:hypothetical protein